MILITIFVMYFMIIVPTFEEIKEYYSWGGFSVQINFCKNICTLRESIIGSSSAPRFAHTTLSTCSDIIPPELLFYYFDAKML